VSATEGLGVKGKMTGGGATWKNGGVGGGKKEQKPRYGKRLENRTPVGSLFGRRNEERTRGPQGKRGINVVEGGVIHGTPRG